MNSTEISFENSIEKVLMSIKSCRNLNQIKSCDKLLELFSRKYENDSEITDFDETYDFLKSQLNSKMDSLSVD